MADSLEEIKRKSVLSHKILTMTGSMGDTTGHVMVRIPGTDEFLYRCRNNKEDVSPAYATPRSLHRVDFEGNPAEPIREGYWISGERFIGVALFRLRPELGCVIHAHPPAQVLCTVTGVQIRPIVGSQNWGGSMVARQGLPVYPRTLTIVNRVLGSAMAAMMNNRDVVLLKGHGNVVVGRTVEEATLRAIQVENLARLCWEIAKFEGKNGGPTWEIPWEDVDDMASGAGGREAVAAQGGVTPRIPNQGWEYYVRMLKEGGLVPDESSVGRVQY